MKRLTGRVTVPQGLGGQERPQPRTEYQFLSGIQDPGPNPSSHVDPLLTLAVPPHSKTWEGLGTGAPLPQEPQLLQQSV